MEEIKNTTTDRDTELLNHCGAVLTAGKRYKFLYGNNSENDSIYEFVETRENGSMRFKNENGYKMIFILTFWDALQNGWVQRIDEPVVWTNV